MLLIGGQGAHTQHKMGSLQDLPHVDMMTPITKFAATVPDTARAADMVSMAFRECYHGAPGPSFLEIPRDVLDATVPVEKARVPKAGQYRASTAAPATPRRSSGSPTCWCTPRSRPCCWAARSGRPGPRTRPSNSSAPSTSPRT